VCRVQGQRHAGGEGGLWFVVWGRGWWNVVNRSAPILIPQSSPPIPFNTPPSPCLCTLHSDPNLSRTIAEPASLRTQNPCRQELSEFR
jgi:hypothetical protein